MTDKPITDTQMKVMKFLMTPFSRFNAWRYIQSKGASIAPNMCICIFISVGLTMKLPVPAGGRSTSVTASRSVPSRLPSMLIRE